MNAVVIFVLGFLAFAVLMLMWAAADGRAEVERRGWRLRYLETGNWAYEEKRQGEWYGFVIPELTDCREPPHHLEIMSPARWSEYPEWTHGRREEILGRIRSQLKAPGYVLKEA